MAGSRVASSGSLDNVGTVGRYWSSTVSGTGSRGLYFYSIVALVGTGNRAGGFAVRCIKD
jgi:hypothetical protein